MGYDNTKREQKSQESRERIIEAAKSLILARGYDAVSVSDITKEAGVSKGAFYIHFKTKEDLIEEMIDIVFLDIKQASNEKDVEGAVYHFLYESVKTIEETGLKMAQTWFSAAANGSIYGRKKFEYDVAYVESLLARKFDSLEAHEKAVRIVSNYYGILLSWCITDGEVNPTDYIKKALDNGIKSILN